ncbi:AAA family ATPase [Virgibacillus sediminis]|uniref:Nuclease SbcCD subunit C n=1 Tax=Virgibacillus sediminis TaxID=202260 RepID=A0ABV7A4N1_9BACI
MIIKKITLHNFRQYYGTQSMEFNTSGKKNVTVIHGENGSGKTALLNAFNWCLYGEAELPDSNKLTNSYAAESAPDGRKVEMYVEMEFASKEVDYILKRSSEGTKFGNRLRSEGEQVLLQYYEDGKLKQLSNPSIEINRILPSNLRNYFFFDGERIDNLSKHNDNDEIKEAVKTVMDLEIIDRGIRHTEDARRDFQKEWASFADEKTKGLLDEQERLKYRQQDLEKEEQQVNQNVKLRTKQIADIDQQLTSVKGISEKQQERKQLEESLADLKESLNQTQTNLRKSVSKNGYLAMSHILAAKVKTTFSEDEQEQRNVYPDLTAQLINSILENGTCICGEELCENHREHLTGLLDQVGAFNQAAMISNLNTQMDLVLDKRERFVEDIKISEETEYNLKEDVRDTENKLEEISVELSNRNFENVADLEANRRHYQSQLNEYQKRLGVIEHSIKEVAKEFKEVTMQIDKQQQIEDKAQLAKRRLDTCEKITGIMQKIYSLKEEEVKTDLQEKIQEVYGNFLRKGFKISLSDDFKLNVSNFYDEKVPLSQGERQITSLSFIGAIVDIARKHYHKKSSNVINEGGIYPLVMDSPFGALDSDHRERVAKGIHRLSDQIIVIVSTSQWKGEVEQSLTPYIDNQYLLQYHDPRQNSDEEFEYTEIKRW